MNILSRLVLMEQAIKSCHYQQDLNWRSVVNYMVTFDYLMANEISISTIFEAGYLISNKNRGWRRIPAMIKHNLILAPEHIERQMKFLIRNQNELNPREFFIDFERIHPYNDGNGRVGEILYYKLTGSFDVPEFN